MSEPWWSDDLVTVYAGDCLDILKDLDDNSIDAVVTDPPYGLVFMGKHWDDHVDNRQFGAWCQQWAAECLRVLKPGGHMLAFGGTRTFHRLTCAIEDARFEIRDSIAWLYGSGFPKSLNVALAIDKAAGATEARGEGINVAGVSGSAKYGTAVSAAAGNLKPAYDDPVTDDAKRWTGWGTALKPSFEPIVVARKPVEGTVAQNVLTHGTGALNIDDTRIGEPDGFGGGAKATSGFVKGYEADGFTTSEKGRWPANAALDESQAAALDRKSGGASRFFYVSKANTAERPREGEVAHPTVKPVALMQWLVKLVTPPGGLVLDPFAGSGTTGEAAVLEGFRAVLIEREADYLPLIKQRLVKPMQQGLFTD